MCTVTFLPVDENSFILTSNRDEKEWRARAEPPRKFSLNDHSVFFPKDMKAGGTWIATGNTHDTLCLLNGAHEKHTPAASYRKSRGLVLLDFFSYRDVHDFAGHYDFSGIEPFTLVLVNDSGQTTLHELVWDGVLPSLTEKDARVPHIWSSVTLYDREVIDLRRKWFSGWLNSDREWSMAGIMQFHQLGGSGDKHNDLVMNRNNEVLTVSITSIEKTKAGTRMQYKDMVDDKVYTIRII